MIKRYHLVAKSVDDISLMNSMGAHAHTKPCVGDVTVKLDAHSLRAILDCLQRVHAALIRELSNEENDETVKKQAYDFAYETETAYIRVMDQLKLSVSDREEIH